MLSSEALPGALFELLDDEVPFIADVDEAPFEPTLEL